MYKRQVEGATLATVEADNSMDFDLGEQFDSESVVATSADNAALDVSESLPAFDLPIQASEDFAVPPLDLPAEIEVPTPASGLAEVSNLAETSSPTLDFAMDLDFPTESTITEEVVSGLDQKVAEPLEDFTFDLPVTNTDSSSTVSYTHLDVYKRQAVSRVLHGDKHATFRFWWPHRHPSGGSALSGWL